MSLINQKEIALLSNLTAHPQPKLQMLNSLEVKKTTVLFMFATRLVLLLLGIYEGILVYSSFMLHAGCGQGSVKLIAMSTAYPD
jgi:hypothetical protein